MNEKDAQITKMLAILEAWPAPRALRAWIWGILRKHCIERILGEVK